MTNDTANEAMKAVIQAMQKDLNSVRDQIDLALDDLGTGNRNAAIGALCPVDNALERMGAMLAAARAVNQAARR